MSRVHPTLQPVLDAFAKTFDKPDDKIAAMGDAGMYADRMAAQARLPLTQRELSNAFFVAWMAGWSARGGK